jgi:hypothetical protein
MIGRPHGRVKLAGRTSFFRQQAAAQLTSRIHPILPANPEDQALLRQQLWNRRYNHSRVSSDILPLLPVLLPLSGAISTEMAFSRKSYFPPPKPVGLGLNGG